MHLNPKEGSLVPRCLRNSRMDSTPFVAWGLFSSVKTTLPKEKDAVREESNVSLQLSLSSYDYMCSLTDGESSGVGESHYGDQRKENKMEMMKSEALSLGDEKLVSDILLEFSLSGDYTHMSKGKCSPETESGCTINQYQSQKPKFGGLSLELSLGSNETQTSKKRGRMESSSSTTRKASSCRNKRVKVGREERSKAFLTELRLGHDPWCIKKKLTESDLGNMSRLLLASELVESHVFPLWNADQLAQIEEGLPVSVWDCDTKTEHQLVFKRWWSREKGGKGANVLIKNWPKDFVKRRGLKVGDEIGLYWDQCSSTFRFALLNPVARH